jgi:hypothetical protein
MDASRLGQPLNNSISKQANKSHVTWGIIRKEGEKEMIVK